jgi:hypothetical protein
MRSLTSRSLLTATFGTVMASASKPPPIGSKGDTGPWGWENAKAWKKQLPSCGALEIACYTDVPQLSLDINVGPLYALDSGAAFRSRYRPVNGIPQNELVVRVEQYLAPEPGCYLDKDWDQADPSVYHGGDAGQEVATLLSLSLGIRMRSGGIIRVFHPDEDPRGHPYEFEEQIPYLLQPYGRRVLPYTRWPWDVETSMVELLGTYANLSSEQARALVRSARAYQEALWIAESDPRQASLRLVSAVEAATQLVDSDAPAPTRLKTAFPDIADRVIRMGDSELVEWITNKFPDQGRSTAKFVDFLLRFRPRPPRRRPWATSDQVSWTRLRKQLNRIYGYDRRIYIRAHHFPSQCANHPMFRKATLLAR